MTLTGKMLIGQQLICGNREAIRAINPATHAALEPAYLGGDGEHVAQACALAWTQAAQARPEPIPVHAEMSSINPVYLFPAALAARSEALAQGFVSSLNQGAGQFCTNPGLVIAVQGPDLDRFIRREADLLPNCAAQTMSDPDIVVVGAGIIGVACALQLARQGRHVVVVDQQEPGMGASYGNAGHLATEQVFPIADLSILKRLPGMLLDPMGPLRLDWKYLPRALPWFLRLLLNLRPASYQRTVAGIRALNEGSLGAWQRLLHSIGCPELLREEGSLLVFERADSRDALDALQQRMQAQQVPVALWSGDAIRQAAPQLSDNIRGGLFFPSTGHFLDPYQVVCELVQAAKASGVQFLKRQVLDGRLEQYGVSLTTDQGPLTARQVLVACGAHSAKLTAALTGKEVPLDTERGYHLMLPHEQQRLPFAVTSLERKFIMTPMTDGLRLAGTVEFAGLDRPANMERAWQLHRLSKGLFRQDLSAEGATPWMGFRPSLPDSLPVIDRVCDGKVLLAFGHQHLGLTQAAVTAEIVGELASSTLVPTPMPYALSRF